MDGEQQERESARRLTFENSGDFIRSCQVDFIYSLSECEIRHLIQLKKAIIISSDNAIKNILVNKLKRYINLINR